MTGPPIRIGRNARDIAVGAGAVWVTTGERRGATGAALCHLVGIDPTTARVVRRQPLACGPGRLAVGAGGVWSTAPPGTRGLVGVRPFGGRMALTGVQLPGESVDVVADARQVWVAGVRDVVAGPYGERRGTGILTTLDSADRSLWRPLALGAAAVWQPRIAAGFGAVWVANTPAGTITRVDAATGRIVARIHPVAAGP